MTSLAKPDRLLEIEAMAVVPSEPGDERTIELRPNFPGGYAIHGQLLYRPWTPTSDGELSVQGGGDGWPWTYTTSVRLEASGPRFSIHYKITNISNDAMLAGIGIHPWFKQPLLVRIPAAHVFARNAAIAISPEPARGAFDLREPQALPPDVDATWADLATPVVELAWPTEGLAAVMTIDADLAVIVGANPTHLDATAVEPETHAPCGLQRLLKGHPNGMQALAPGKTLTLGVTIAFHKAR